MEKKYDGHLNFATDAWTSLNLRDYVAITVHLEHQGEPISMLLDIVEVVKSHIGVNLASAFAKVFEEYAYGIFNKVLKLDNKGTNLGVIGDSGARIKIMYVASTYVLRPRSLN